MTHYSVIVALPPTGRDEIEQALLDALHPFYEGEVEPYREYIEDLGQEYREAVRFVGASDPQRNFADLDESEVFAVISEYAGGIHKETRPDSTVVYYTMSTFNLQGKWDYYSIGGRWAGYLPVKPGYEGDPRLIIGERRPRNRPVVPGWVDGGPRGLLDFEELRAPAAADAAERYDNWTSLVVGLPPAQPWSHFRDLHERNKDDYPIEQARADYRSQNRVRIADTTGLFPASKCAVSHFGVSREQYIQRAVEQSAPAFAYLDLDGTWHSPDDSEEEEGDFYRRINHDLDRLSPDTVLVVVDCHT
jgi:hypothetical protein